MRDYYFLLPARTCWAIDSLSQIFSLVAGLSNSVSSYLALCCLLLPYKWLFRFHSQKWLTCRFFVGSETAATPHCTAIAAVTQWLPPWVHVSLGNLFPIMVSNGIGGLSVPSLRAVWFLKLSLRFPQLFLRSKAFILLAWHLGSLFYAE